jgi:hypothetical protein
MKKYIHVLMFYNLILSQGCLLDMLNSDEQTVVGDIILVNSHVHKNNGFRLNYYTGNYNRNLIQESVESLFGDDTVLIVKTKDTTGYKFYQVKHNKGGEPISVQKIDSGIKIYNYYFNLVEHKYYFENKDENDKLK